MAYGEGVGVRQGRTRAFSEYHLSNLTRMRLVWSGRERWNLVGWTCVVIDRRDRAEDSAGLTTVGQAR
jgi:hypothetical protein